MKMTINDSIGCKKPKHVGAGRSAEWFIGILACIALSSALLFFFLQDSDVNNYHPSYRTMWQAYYWFADTPFGSLGMDDWRLEVVTQ